MELISAARLLKIVGVLEAASHALRSYQYGNSATELAEEIANNCDAAVAGIKELYLERE